VKIKLLAILSAGCLVTLAALYVSRAFDSELGAQAGERSKEDGVAEEYHETVSKGLEYLAKNQCKDGHWEGDGGKHPVAMTGLVGLALLMQRQGQVRGLDLNEVSEPKHEANIRKAVDWLLEKSQGGRDGLIFSEHASESSRYMEGHGLATLFLAGVCIHETDAARRKKLTEVLTRAVKYICKARSSQGGWYHTSRVEGHDLDAVLPTVVQLQALHAAEYAGVPVKDAMGNGLEYLKISLGKPGRNGNRLADTAAALACLEVFNYGDADKAFDPYHKQIPLSRLKVGRDDLIHYYYAQVLYYGYSESWTAYRKATFKVLRDNQKKDGSWPASDGLGVGPVYSTALWCTVLQLDGNSHPSTRRVYAVK
jgi:hypothetical protein